MKTPAGFECRYFYGDYRRGRNHEECRFLENLPSGRRWSPDLCRTCPIPGILNANACPHMVLQGEISGGILGLGRRVKVSAYCLKSQKNVPDPHIGCGVCHPLPPFFEEDDHDPDASTRSG